jgi:phenylpyruvate tautomerase PptA (4-oxalocrotonate tautomerase family)
MPLIKIHTSVTVQPGLGDDIMKECTEMAAQAFGKPSKYVMAMIDTVPMTMNGQHLPCAYVEIMNIGSPIPETNKALSASLCALLEKKLGIHAEQIYINFTCKSGNEWGWNGTTF